SDKGILLDTSWRMHTSICSFISEAVYDGRLKAEADCARQRLIMNGSVHPALKLNGISVIEMAHHGCSQSSEAEALTVRDLIDALIGTEFLNREGATGTMG